MSKKKTKKCPKCGEVKPVSEFYKNKGKKDGLHSWCKECQNAAKKNWQKENPEKVKAAHKKQYDANPEKHRAANKKYMSRIESYFKRLANKIWGNSSYWAILEDMYENQNRECALTGLKLTRENISLDHKVAKANGGNNKLDNLQFVTKEINGFKKALSQKEFINLCRLVVKKADVEINKNFLPRHFGI